jgi:hypothetical protein
MLRGLSNYSTPSLASPAGCSPGMTWPTQVPEHIKQYYAQRLTTWLDQHRDQDYMHEHEIRHTERLINYLDQVKTPHSEAFEMPKLLNDFKQFYTQYDQRRGKNFAETFPSFKSWYESIQV